VVPRRRLRFNFTDRPSKLDAIADKLSGWLRSESNRSRKQKRTIKQLYVDLVAFADHGRLHAVVQ